MRRAPSAIPPRAPGRQLPSMARSHRTGKRAESLAADALERAGWAVLARNWRAGPCELDVVARRGRTVAFVEVRARVNSDFGHPLATITAVKRGALARAAGAWIAAHGRAGDEYRFDAVIVLRGNDGQPNIEHVESAW
jgi:putative endonuclease